MRSKRYEKFIIEDIPEISENTEQKDKDIEFIIDKNMNVGTLIKNEDIEIALAFNPLNPEKIKVSLQYDILKY